MFQINAQGIWGMDTDFKLVGSYAQLVKRQQLEGDLSLELSGSNIYPTTLTYSLATNTTTFKTQVQVEHFEFSYKLFQSIALWPLYNFDFRSKMIR